MEKLSLGQISFYWRMTSKPNVPINPVPDFVEFEFDFLKDYQLIIQSRNEKTWTYLERIYRENYNVGYLQEGHSLADQYGGDFIACIESALAKYSPKAKRITEIGAGGGYILKKFKEKGYEVAMIDPSPIAAAKGKEFDIEVIPEFYPTQSSIPNSDVILHYDVLEHIPNPSDFISHHIANLNPNGIVVFAVPDCSPYIAFGDISMILHEHLNYFDAESLRNVVEAGGLEVLEILKGGYGGVLYCIARSSNANPQVWSSKSGTNKFNDFISSVKSLSSQLDQFITEGLMAGNTLGCYVPLRAIPYLSRIGVTSGFRFFDDDSGIYGKYFDGFPVPIENMNDLKENPVSHLIILSFAFGNKIRDRINEQISDHKINIFCLSDILPNL
ncbi:class I SAM-dependent methyltransferase [Pseudanabaena sp. Chao 1811]|uniref:class I SAM-dependent methyltransferase n=1 Tax=Pseudanabaena sp. Chao 1811 TaxID=2963092 RepID=UPI0022F40810|nr:class I SAM-dependent methyltransferase [Pseudanabaena sp. Chao 1811]